MANNNKGGFNFNFNFGQPKKEEEEEKPHFQLTEQMLINELPNDIVTQFIDVHKLIQENSKSLSTNATKVSGCSIESDCETIKKDIIECLNSSLTSLAHQIDFGQSSFNECKNDLEISKSDYQYSSHYRSIPSPFIKRYVSKIKKHAEELSQSLASYNSRFQPQQIEQNQNKQSETQILYNLLSEQQQAILRCSSRVAAIKNRFEKVRSTVAAKLDTNLNLELNDDIQQNLCAQRIQDEIKRYENDKRQKRIKIIEETDIFGNSKAPPPKSNNLFGGFNFGKK